MEGTETQAIFKFPSVRGFVAQHSTHVTDEQLRRLTLLTVTEVPDIVHELSVNVELLEYIAPPYWLRRLKLPSAVTEVPDIVHEVSVNVDESECIATPYCISEHDRCKQPSQQYTTNQQLACLLFLHRHTQALTTSCNAGGVIDDHSNK